MNNNGLSVWKWTVILIVLWIVMFLLTQGVAFLAGV